MKNYWILQANPKHYFIVHYFLADYLKTNPEYECWWEVERQYRDEFQIGDIAFIYKTSGEPTRASVPKEYNKWRSSQDRNRGDRGIYALGEITSLARYESLEPEEQLKKYHIGETWRRAKDFNLKVHFRFTRNLVDCPIIFDKDKPPWRDLIKISNIFAQRGAGQGKKNFKLIPEEGLMLLNFCNTL